MEDKVPVFLKEMLERQYGNQLTEEIIDGYSQERKVTLRVNTLKSHTEEIENELQNADIEYEKVPWSKEAFVIRNVREKEIQKLDIYKDGKIYLQSLSSMLPPIMLKPEKETDILDMAAAPGGKTTQMAALVNNEARITACEMNAIRAERLKYNIEKQGASCVYVMVVDARNIDSFFSFDQILLDAPCSGSGTLSSKNPGLEKTFTKQLIDKSKKAQIKLLKKAIDVLKPGKEMVYSTCSILQEENEDIVNQVLNNNLEIVPIKIEGMEQLPLLPSKIKGCLCVKPNELYEGFFIAKIKKRKGK